MKDATREGLHVKNKKEEKESVTEEEEELFWNLNLLGMSTAKSLLNTVYFYNGKLFGLRGGEHRSLVLTNFEVGSNFVKFEENSCKTFHGGLTDLKYIPKVVKHICHPLGETHERCLVEMYKLYIGLVQTIGKDCNAFYFRPSKSKLRFEKAPVGINKLNDILPEMCKAAGLKRKTSHCLCVNCASSLFNAGVEEKLIRERTGHRSDSLFKYEKPSKEKITEVSSVLGPSTSATEVKISEEKDLSCLTSSDAQDVVSAGPLNSCSFANCSVKIKVQYLQ